MTAVDVGDGWAARCRAAEAYADRCRLERDEAVEQASSYLELLELALRNKVALRTAATDLLAVVQGLPESSATRSRDYGRGYALACRDIAHLLHTVVEEHT